MARLGSRVLPVALLLVAAYFMAPAFVSGQAPQTVPEQTVPFAAAVAGAALPLLAAQPAMAYEYLMPPGIYFVGVFLALLSAFVIIPSFVFPGED